ncbi:MAG: hypothetical protein QNJ44_15630 [Rhodobacter sp.]|nr:hypothetical protein [Rhodobacter sp.]
MDRFFKPTASVPMRARVRGLCLAVLLALAGTAGPSLADGEPGAENPIQNPQNLTVFPVDDLATLRSQQNVATTALVDYVAANADLTAWTQTGQQLMQTDPCTQSIGRRLLAGRVTTPEFEQAICMTPIGLSLYYGQKPTAQGQFLRYDFPKPGVGTAFRNFDAQTGLFDRSGGTDQFLHMDIATAHRDFAGNLTVSIVGYDPKTDTSEQKLSLRDSWTDDSGRQVSGDVALAVGDFNGDSTLDLIAWADTSTGTVSQQQGRIDMASFTYDPKERELTHVKTIEVPTVGKPASMTAASGDFATLGTDQAMLAYYPAYDQASGNRPIQLLYFQLNDKVEPAQPQLAQALTGKPTGSSYFDIRAGLFNFDPSQTSPEAGAPGFHTRQLAVSWTMLALSYTSIVAVEQGGKALKESPIQKLGSPQNQTIGDMLGPSLAVGNFVGLQDDGVTPLDQIAVAIPTGTGTPNTTVTELVIASVAYDNTTGEFSITEKESFRDPRFAVRGLVYGPGLVALDSLGRAFFLGNPAHIRVPDLIDPQYVVYMPPHHVDCLPDPSNPATCSVVNISAFNDFNITLNDEQSSTIKQQSTDTAGTNFGTSASISVSETVSAGIMEIADLSASAQVTDTFSYESNTVKKDTNENYTTITTQKSATTNIDDQLGFNQRVIDIWRYPVFGLDLQQSKTFPYYEITIPGPLTPFQSDGLTVSWFNPSHINNNALSYPTIGDPNFPSDLGSFTYNDNGTEVSKTVALNDRTVRSFAGNSQTYSLTYTEGSGGSSERSYDYTMSNSVDIKTGFSAKVQIEIVNTETKVDTSMNLTNKASWGNTTVASRSMSDSRGITLNQPAVPGIQTKAYNYQTLIYITGNGGIKVAHAVDFDAQTGRAWWADTYRLADPALNLPLRLVQSSGSTEWKLNTTDSYSWMRGIALTTNELNEATGIYPYLSGSVNKGDKVRVVVDIYNLSLGSTSSDTQVQYAYQALDPTTFAPVGPETVFATSATVKLAPLAQQQIVGVWDTGMLTISEATPYRFVIKLLTDDANDLHGTAATAGGNNMGVWPYNNTGVFVFPDAGAAPTPQAAAIADLAITPGSALSLPHAPDGTATTGLDIAPLPAADAGHHSHVAKVTINSDTDHRGIVHVALSRPGNDGDGRAMVLSHGMIWGLPKGKRTVSLAIPHKLADGVTAEEAIDSHSSGQVPIDVHLFSHHN